MNAAVARAARAKGSAARQEESKGAPRPTSTHTETKQAGSPKRTKWVLLTSAKGGSGKTTTAYNLAVFAANDGLRVGIVDLDVQSTLTAWWRNRPPEAPPIAHFSGRMEQFQSAVARAEAAQLDLIVIDSPPAVEAFDGAIRLLIRRADLCLVPSNQGGADVGVAVGWMKFLKRERVKAACILNRAKTNSRSFQPTRIELQSAGKLCPFEVRDLEDIKETAALGVGVLELAKANGADDYRGVWTYVRSELGIGAEESSE